jgi:hypothetical protein
MNRIKHPLVTLKFSIKGANLRAFLHNEGSVLAKNVRCVYWIPLHFLNEGATQSLVLKSIDTGWPYDYFYFDYSNSQVIHSDLTFLVSTHKIAKNIVGFFETYRYDKNRIPSSPDGPFIEWKVFADNARPTEGKTMLTDCLNEILITRSKVS